MNNAHDVQQALMCLEALDEQAGLTAFDISRRQGIDLSQCETLLSHLADGGLLLAHEGGYRLAKPLQDIAALEVLQAVWSPPRRNTPFQLLFGPPRGPAFHRTLNAAGRVGMPLVFAEG